ncbi:Rap1a/Tai family immunity protein [Kiloniella sp. EL199]|uniref:Rap1a/Tai family immunity protein n=1 Tax=Kiloniella sp. EL199 TaxID=2107581 RepID=UPI000EA2D90E
MKHIITAIFIIGSTLVQAKADFSSGEDLYNTCSQKDYESFCLGYFTGFNSGTWSGAITVYVQNNEYNDEKISKILNYCLPVEFSIYQFKDIVLEYIGRNQASKREQASYAITLALSDAYPCN